MSGAELAARITAAAAAHGDFERETHEYALQAGPEPRWPVWAPRLSTVLGALLDELGTPAGTGTAPPVPGRLDEHSRVLGAALAQWATRDDSKAQPEVCQAANTAMDTIDAMLRELHQARQRLVGEMRDSDDATAVRVDRLLLGRREPDGRGGTS